MKRSEALAPLSREHHVALELALRLRRAGADDVAGARTAFLEFVAGDGEAHFRAEEDILLPAVAGVLPADDPDVARVLEEHAEIRRRADGLAHDGDPPAADLVALGNLLNGHVRHEERVLFPRIEAALGEADLARLAASLRAAGESREPPRV